MLQNRLVYLNGDFVEWDRATVHIMSHSLARGSAIFEVISLHKTDQGPVVFRLDEHIHRLFKSAQLLSMELPLSKEATHEAVLATVRQNRLEQGMIKVVCYYHEVAFDISPPKAPLRMCIVALDPAQDLSGIALFSVKSWSACISPWKKLHPDMVPIEAKVAANYLNGMMARLDAKRRGFDMGILLDAEGFVAEGSVESVFWLSGGVLTSPALGTILQGITRKSVLEAAKRIGLKTAEGRRPPGDLIKADEIFVSCSPEKIMPIHKIEDRALKEVPGPITVKLQALFEEICSGRDPRFTEWLFPVK